MFLQQYRFPVAFLLASLSAMSTAQRGRPVPVVTTIPTSGSTTISPSVGPTSTPSFAPSAVPTSTCDNVCVVNNASDTWDVSDRDARCQVDVYSDAYDVNNGFCHKHAYWNGGPRTRTGSLRYCIWLLEIGDVKTITFDLTQDEYNDRPVSQRDYFTIYMEQAPAYCKYHADQGRQPPRGQNSERYLNVLEDGIIDGDSQPDNVLAPDRDPSLPKVILKPLESLCWEQSNQQSCEAQIYCKSCTGADRFCRWNQGQCNHQTPGAIQTHYTSLGSSETHCPDHDRDATGFTLSRALNIQHAGVTIRGLGVVGFGREGSDNGGSAGIRVNMNAGNRISGGCGGDDRTVTIEGCLIGGNRYAGITVFNGRDNPSSHPHVVVRSSSQRSTIIAQNFYGMNLLHVEVGSLYVNTSVTARIGGELPGSLGSAVSGTNINSNAFPAQAVGIRMFRGGTLKLISSDIRRNGLNAGGTSTVLAGLAVTDFSSNSLPGYISIESSNFTENFDGVNVDAAANTIISVSNSIFTNQTSAGLKVATNAGSVEIQGSTFEDHSNYGCEVQSTATISGCTFRRNGGGLRIYDSAVNTQVTYCTFEDNTGDVRIYAFESAAPNTTVEGCILQRNANGLTLLNSDATVRNTQIYDTLQRALFVTSINAPTANNHTRIIGSIFQRGGEGLVIEFSQFLSIINTIVSDFDGVGSIAGVRISGTDTSFSNATIMGNSGHGLYVNGERTSIVSSTFGDNGVDGVHLAFGAGSSVVSGQTASEPTVVIRNGRDGISVNAPNCAIEDYVLVGVVPQQSTDGSVNGNSRNGIVIEVLATNTSIRGDGSTATVVLSGNRQYGLLVEAPNTTVAGCIIGLDAAGTITNGFGNSNGGILGGSDSANFRIGSANSLTVVSGNNNTGIALTGAHSVVDGAFVGVDLTGENPIGNMGSGILVGFWGDQSRIGGESETVVASNLDGPGIDVVGTNVTISNVKVGCGSSTSISLPNCGAGIWLRSSADHATISGSTIGGAFVGCGSLAEAASGILGNGINIESESALVEFCSVGIGNPSRGRGAAVDLGPAGSGIYVGSAVTDGLGANVKYNTIGFSHESGILISSLKGQIEHNFIGVCDSQNCTNLRHGLEFEVELDPSAVIFNNTIGFNGNAGLRIGENTSAEAEAQLINDISDVTNSWKFASACDVCSCSENTTSNEFEVDCSGTYFGPDFPLTFPDPVISFFMRGVSARSLDFIEIASTVKIVDVATNPNLDISLPLSEQVLPNLRLIYLDGTILNSGLKDAVQTSLNKEVFEFMSFSNSASPSDAVLNLTGFGRVGAILWANKSACPIGYFESTAEDVVAGPTTGLTTGLCLRCPSNTYQPYVGQYGILSCEACPEGTFDYDSDPSTECTASTLTLDLSVWPESNVNAVDIEPLAFPVCAEPCIHTTYQINYSYVWSLNPVDEMFGPGSDLSQVSFETLVYSPSINRNRRQTSCDPVSSSGVLVSPEQVDIRYDGRDGSSVFKALEFGYGYHAEIRARNRTTNAVTTVRSWCFDVLQSDVELLANYCANGGQAIEDRFQLNGAVDCDCPVDFFGDRCEISVAEAIAMSSGDDKTSTTTIAIVTVLVLIIAILVIFFALQWRKNEQLRKLRNLPVDFTERLKQLEEAGLVRPSMVTNPNNPEDSHPGFVEPTELQRNSVHLIDVLGSGAFGEVMKGAYNPPDHKTLEFTVAVKVLKGEPSNDEREELLKEAVITAQFSHVNVVGLVGVVTSGSPYMLVLQFCENGSLQSILKHQKDLQTKTLLEYCLGIAKGMHYLANKRFVHRDLATRNVLVDHHRSSKVADFGLSRDMESSEYYTAGTDAKMPIRWSAIECILEQKFSEKSDVWSFGVTMIEVFTRGETPYRGWINSYVVEQVMDGFRLPPPMKCPDQVYDESIHPCFNPNPGSRPTFSFLIERLDLYIRNLKQLTISSPEDRARRMSSTLLKGAGIIEAPSAEQVAAAEAENDYEDFGVSDDSGPKNLFMGFAPEGNAVVKDLANQKISALLTSTKATELATMMIIEEARALNALEEKEREKENGYLNLGGKDVDFISLSKGPSRQTSEAHHGRIDIAVEDNEATFTFSDGEVSNQSISNQSNPILISKTKRIPEIQESNVDEPEEERAKTESLLDWHQKHDSVSYSNDSVQSIVIPDSVASKHAMKSVGKKESKLLKLGSWRKRDRRTPSPTVSSESPPAKSLSAHESGHLEI